MPRSCRSRRHTMARLQAVSAKCYHRQPRNSITSKRFMMPRALGLIPCIAAGVFAAAVALQGQTTPWQPPDAAGQGQTPVMPVHQEPHHRQLFQYGPMRIIDLQIPPGDASWFHSHDWPVFYLTVADSQTVTQVLGQEAGGGRGAGRGGAPAPGGPAAGAP